jgi:hypothetical protein
MASVQSGSYAELATPPPSASSTTIPEETEDEPSDGLALYVNLPPPGTDYEALTTAVRAFERTVLRD